MAGVRPGAERRLLSLAGVGWQRLTLLMGADKAGTKTMGGFARSKRAEKNRDAHPRSRLKTGA